MNNPPPRRSVAAPRRPTITKLADGIHARFWLITGAVFIGILWLLSGVLFPFILGLAIAYFFEPVVRRLQRVGVPRWAGALLVLLAFIGVAVTVSLLLFPIIRAQIADLVHSLPGYIDRLENDFWPRVQRWLETVPFVDAQQLSSNVTSYTNDAIGVAGGFLKSILTSGLAVLDVVAVLVLAPVIALYLMRDWNKLVATVDGLLPLRYAGTIHTELRKIDLMIDGFVRGQAITSLILCVFYSVGLSLAGLKYGVIIGLVTGVLSFVPMLGTLVGILTSLIMAFIQFTAFNQFVPLIGVFLGAQILENYILTPKLVGDRVGLHPVWTIFAVIAGGKLLGPVGVILGVPLAGTINILLRLAVRHYKMSPFFAAPPESAVLPPEQAALPPPPPRETP